MGPAKHTKKTRKGTRGVGWVAHITSRDPRIGRGTRSCAIRRGMSKKRASAIFDLSLRVGRPLRVGPPYLCVLRGLLCKFFLLSVRARFKIGSLKSSRNCAMLHVIGAKRWVGNTGVPKVRSRVVF